MTMFCHSHVYTANMKVWILIIAVLSLAVLVSSQTCPPKHFSAVFVASVDQTVDIPSVQVADPELTFFKEVLKFQEDEMQYALDNAIKFYNDSFGLDFSVLPPNEQNQRFFENAIMTPAIQSKDLNFLVTANNWIRNGNTHSTCYPIQDGGLGVSFSDNQTLYGTYGGANGKPAGVRERLAYGFLHIDVCEQSPVIIHIRSAAQFRMEPIDGTLVITFLTYNRVLGRGRAHGVGSIKPDPDEPKRFRITAQIIYTS